MTSDASRNQGSSSPPPPSTYSASLYSYYYNGVASVANALLGEGRLQDNTSCWILGTSYEGVKTTKWASHAVKTLPYFTYRKNLREPLANGSVHDAGWGCMIRTGQMMLCEAVRRLFCCNIPIVGSSGGLMLMGSPLPSSAAGGSFPPLELNSPVLSPRGGPLPQSSGAGSLAGSPASGTLSPPSPATNSGAYSDALMTVHSFFRDTSDAPFGLHRYTNAGALLGVPCGQWFSPTVLCKSTARLVAESAEVNTRLHVVTALDQQIFSRPIMKQLVVEDRAVLLLVPLMLGMTSITPSNEKVVTAFLELPSCVGLVGGKPKQSLYFVGHQEDDIFYLDPHVVQSAFVSAKTVGNMSGPRGTAQISSLDPCMLACFLFLSAEQYAEWEDAMTTINRLGEFPVICIAKEDTAAQRRQRRMSMEAEVSSEHLFREDGSLSPSSRGGGGGGGRVSSSGANVDDDSFVDDCGWDGESPPNGSFAAPASRGHSSPEGRLMSETQRHDSDPLSDALMATSAPNAANTRIPQQQQQQQQQGPASDGSMFDLL